MSYQSGFLHNRVTVAKRATESASTFGKAGQPQYEILGTFWMNETFSRGAKALHEGALDAYDTVMFRMRWNKDIDRWCLLQYNDKWYQITSFNADFRSNQIQITATELANQQVNIVGPPTYEIEIWMDVSCTQRPIGELREVYAQFNVDLGEYKTFTNSQTTFVYDENGQNENYDRLLYFGKYQMNVWKGDPIFKGLVMPLQLDFFSQPEDFKADGDYSFGRIINR